MRGWLGDFPEDFTTVTCMFTTHDALGGPVAPLSAFEAADVIIYKNGSATQKTSTNGVTMTSPFDSIVGLHCLVIDTSNDTGDSGFWTRGAVYTLVLSPDSETIDGKTALNVIGQFGLDMNNVAAVKAKTDNLPSDPADASDIASAFSTVNGTLSTIAGYVDTEVATIVTQTSAASIRSAVGLASANLDTQLDALPTAAEINAEVDTALADYDAPTKAELDTAIALVTAKTNSLTFTVAGVLDANTKYVAGTAVTGAGTEADPWGP